jgi:DNA modification methylase
MADVIVTDWFSCYGRGWGAVLSKGSYKHPAKVSFALAKRIYEHAIEEGWLIPGKSIVGDCFAGVGGFAFHALANGIGFIGVELEENFQKLAVENINEWNRKYGNLPKWSKNGTVILGDSRHFSELVNGVDGILSSPPYSTSLSDGKRINNYRPDGTPFSYGFENPDQLGAMTEGNVDAVISSPPYAEARIGKESGQEQCGRGDQYGDNKAQLGGMQEGNIDAIISSPPFGEQETGGGIAKYGHRNCNNFETSLSQHAVGYQGQGDSEGQLATLKDNSEELDAIISSPPYEETNPTCRRRRFANEYANGEETIGAIVSSPPYENSINENHSTKYEYNIQGNENYQRSYGDNKENLGNKQGETFWEASLKIVQECFKVLPHGGHSIWVLKDYVKDGKIVPFSSNWQKLCEFVGFETLHIHRAMQVETVSTSHTLDGEKIEKTKSRLSFFRKLCEARGSPEIHNEVILCCRKP